MKKIYLILIFSAFFLLTSCGVDEKKSETDILENNAPKTDIPENNPPEASGIKSAHEASGMEDGEQHVWIRYQNSTESTAHVKNLSIWTYPDLDEKIVEVGINKDIPAQGSEQFQLFSCKKGSESNPKVKGVFVARDDNDKQISTHFWRDGLTCDTSFFMDHGEFEESIDVPD